MAWYNLTDRGDINAILRRERERRERARELLVATRHLPCPPGGYRLVQCARLRLEKAAADQTGQVRARLTDLRLLESLLHQHDPIPE